MNMSKLVKKICIPTAIIILLAIVPLLLHSKATQNCEVKEKQKPVIIYVPGWKNKGVSQEEQVMLLQKIYPHSKIFVKVWDSDGDFETCKNRADKYVEKLFSEICAMAQEEQRNLILIGHSLGGRIAVKTVARLKSKNICIRKGVFLGAAIPDNASEIAMALGATIEPCINIHNKNDFVLRHIYSVFGDGLLDALGAYGYSKPFYGVHMLQYEIKSNENTVTSLDDYKGKMDNHNVKQYMAKLAEIEKTYLPPSSTDWRNALAQTLPTTWTVLEKCCNWRLETKKMTSTYRIVNAHNQTIFCGNKQNALSLWEQYSTYYTKTTQDAINQIQVIQDKKNPIIKVVPLGWENLDEINGWRLQRKKVPFRGMVYRIIDPKDFQRANGSEQKMREAFNNIRIQIEKRKARENE